jgi:hypothetical protein
MSLFEAEKGQTTQDFYRAVLWMIFRHGLQYADDSWGDEDYENNVFCT